MFALGKLSSNGVALAVGGDANGSLVDMMLNSLVEASAAEGLRSSSSYVIKSLSEWIKVKA